MCVCVCVHVCVLVALHFLLCAESVAEEYNAFFYSLVSQVSEQSNPDWI